jgi:hypothetical protein
MECCEYGTRTPTSKPSSMEGVDGGDGRSDGVALDVNVPARILLVDVDVNHFAVPAALVDDVSADVGDPLRGSLRGRIEHVGELETLGSDGWVQGSQPSLLPDGTQD